MFWVLFRSCPPFAGTDNLLLKLYTDVEKSTRVELGKNAQKSRALTMEHYYMHTELSRSPEC